MRIIATDFERTASFYERISGQALVRATPSFAGLRTAGGPLAIGNPGTLAPCGGERVARPAAKHSAIIGFRVADVDAEFGRLAGFIGEALVQAPTTVPRGNRSQGPFAHLTASAPGMPGDVIPGYSTQELPGAPWRG